MKYPPLLSHCCYLIRGGGVPYTLISIPPCHRPNTGHDSKGEYVYAEGILISDNEVLACVVTAVAHEFVALPFYYITSVVEVILPTTAGAHHTAVTAKVEALADALFVAVGASTVVGHEGEFALPHFWHVGTADDEATARRRMPAIIVGQGCGELCVCDARSRLVLHVATAVTPHHAILAWAVHCRMQGRDGRDWRDVRPSVHGAIGIVGLAGVAHAQRHSIE